MRSCNLIGTGSSSCAAISTFAIGKLASIVLLVATAMILSLWSDPDAWASDEVPIHFQTGAPPDGAWPVIERWMRALDEDPPYNFDLLQDHLDRTVQFGWAKNTDDALADFLNHEIFWAYVDLDGDGIDEMMVFIAIGPYCGTDGCGTIELHRSGSGWRIEDGISMSDTNDLCYRRNGPNGLPMFRTQSEVFWWSAGRLNGVCYAYCSHWWDRDAIDPDELARMTPEKLAVRNEIREEPWCATGSAN
jgi:hypothetical protein